MSYDIEALGFGSHNGFLKLFPCIVSAKSQGTYKLSAIKRNFTDDVDESTISIPKDDALSQLDLLLAELRPRSATAPQDILGAAAPAATAVTIATTATAATAATHTTALSVRLTRPKFMYFDKISRKEAEKKLHDLNLHEDFEIVNGDDLRPELKSFHDYVLRQRDQKLHGIHFNNFYQQFPSAKAFIQGFGGIFSQI